MEENELKNPKDIKVGDKVTVVYYSDKQPATVVKISKSGTKISVRINKSVNIGSGYENVWKIFDEFADEEERIYRLHKDGYFYSKDCGTYLDINRHYRYFDYEY